MGAEVPAVPVSVKLPLLTSDREIVWTALTLAVLVRAPPAAKSRMPPLMVVVPV